MEGFKTMAERSTRAGRMNSVRKPAMILRGTQVGCTLAPAIEDQQLMSDQHGFGDNGTESTRPGKSGQGDDQMNEYDSEVVIPAMVSTPQKPLHSGPHLAVRHRQGQHQDSRRLRICFADTAPSNGPIP